MINYLGYKSNLASSIIQSSGQLKVLALAFLVVAVAAKHEYYQGWKSYYVGPIARDQKTLLSDLSDALELDFLSQPLAEREGVTLVKPHQVEKFVTFMEKFNIPYRIHTEDVKAALDKDDENISNRNKTLNAARNGHNLPYHNYQELEVIYAYMDDVARRYPNVVTLVEPAKSFEGRPIKYLKISTTNFKDTSKAVIFIDGGIHAREWISPPSVTWAIHKLVEDVTEPDLLKRFDWIVLPVVNPDGYKYTFDSDRFWRKTRSTDTSPLSNLCPGVDGNRNYDFSWNSIGTSDFACSDLYAGSHAFSEVETRVVRDILHENLARTALYITVHSYGSMLLYPWGHDGTLSHNSLALHSVGIAMADAIYANTDQEIFPRYVVGNAAQVLYSVAGASEDYAHSIGVPLSYTIELPGLSGGLLGFHLHPSYIQLVVEETWAGFAVAARRAGDLVGK